MVRKVRVTLKDRLELRLLIAMKGFSLRGFSREIGISQGYLSQILKGSKNPSPVIAFKVASGLGKEVSEIFFIHND